MISKREIDEWNMTADEILQSQLEEDMVEQKLKDKIKNLYKNIKDQ